MRNPAWCWGCGSQISSGGLQAQWNWPLTPEASCLFRNTLESGLLSRNPYLCGMMLLKPVWSSRPCLISKSKPRSSVADPEYLAQGPLLVSTKLRNLFQCLLGQGVLMCSSIHAVPIPYLIYLCSPRVLYWYLWGSVGWDSMAFLNFSPLLAESNRIWIL